MCAASRRLLPGAQRPAPDFVRAAPPALIDTHCHLGDAQFAEDRDATVARARAAGVGHVIVIADSADATRSAIAIAQRYRLSATAGVHPHNASSWTDHVHAALAAAVQAPTVVAVGETGLDYHYDHSPRDIQRRVFAAHLRLAAETGKPVVIHARDADDDMAAILREWGVGVPALVLHSFSSGPAVRDAGRAAGAYFSFSGMITFKSWTQDDVLRDCPADRLLVETDGPYLAPVPFRGKRNEPAFVTHVAARAAAVRGIEAAELAQLTTANAIRCFGARVAPAPAHQA
jgi:TatD DNase family protein